MALLHRALDGVRGSLAVALAFERAGLLTLADRLDAIRDRGDLVAIPLPTGPGQLRVHRFKMLRFAGGDHGVDAYVVHGWLGFERPLPDAFLRTVRSTGGVVIDVGANSGFYALLAVESRNDVVVHAFEPFPPVTEVLRANLARNRSGRRVQVHTQAAAEVDGELTLYIPRDSGAVETSASLDPTFKDDVAAEVKIATVTLDRFWEDAGRPDVQVIKVDTEGSEHRVLAGAARMVAATRPIIFCEVLPRAGTRELDAFCDDHRLTRVRLRPDVAVVAPRVAFDRHAWNHCFVPTERFETFTRDVLTNLLPLSDEAEWDTRPDDGDEDADDR